MKLIWRLLVAAFLVFSWRTEAVADNSVPDVKFKVRELKLSVIDLHFPIQDLGGKVELNMKETDTEITIELSGDILFDFDKANIRPAAEASLQQVLDLINKRPGAPVRIEGFTDSKGDDAYNLKLSVKRADSVKQWFTSHGAKASALITKGWGEAKPVAPNQRPDGSDDPTSRQKNRRVEITVKKKGAAG